MRPDRPCARIVYAPGVHRAGRPLTGSEASRTMDYLKEVDYSHPQFGDLYDELPLWSAPFGLRLLDRIPMRSGITILDVGAGTGFLTLELAQRCGPTTQVIAVDPWNAGMNRLRRKLAHLGLANVTLVEHDAADIELSEESIDVIVSNLGINNFENVDDVMRRLSRIAKPRASLFLTTNVAGHMAEFYDVFRQTLIELGQTERLSNLEAHVLQRGTIDSVSRMLGNAGFTVVGAETDSFRMRFVDGSSLLRHYFVRLGFMPGWKTIVAKEGLEPTFEALERNLNKLAKDRGELSLTVPMAYIEARK